MHWSIYHTHLLSYPERCILVKKGSLLCVCRGERPTSYFPHGCDKTPYESNRKKDRFTLAHGLRTYAPHGGEGRTESNSTQKVTLHLQLGMEDKEHRPLFCSPFLAVCAVQEPSQGMVQPTGSGSSYFNELKIISYKHAQMPTSQVIPD